MRLTSALLTTLLLCGCSLVLDPEVCSDKSDCDSKQTCEDGICLGERDPDPDVSVDASSDDGGDPEMSVDTGDATDVSNPDVKHEDEGPDVGESTDMTPDMAPPGIAPTCEIDKPDDSPTNQAEADVRLIISDDDGPASALVVTFAGEEITVPESYVYEGVVAIMEGDNTLRLDATDGDGLSCNAEVVIVGDFSPPEIDIFDSTDDVIVHRERVKRIEGTVVDENYARRRLEIELGGEAFEAEIAWNGEEFQFPLTLAGGENEVSITATDDAGNESEPLEFTVLFDNVQPEVDIDAPANNGPAVELDRVEVRGSATKGGQPLGNAQVAIAACQGRRCNETNARTDRQDGTFAKNVSLFVGENEIEVCVTDPRSGNEGCDTVDVTRQDPDACVAFDEGLEFVTENDVVELSGTACPVVVSVMIEVGDADPVAAELADGRWSLEVMLPNPGRYPTTAEARGGGNVARAQAVLVWDDSPPGVAITRPDEHTCHNGEVVQVCGRATDPESGIVSVLINGEDAVFDEINGNFCHDTPVDEGAGEPILARAVNGAGAFRDDSIEIDVDREAGQLHLWSLEADGAARAKVAPTPVFQTCFPPFSALFTAISALIHV